MIRPIILLKNPLKFYPRPAEKPVGELVLERSDTMRTYSKLLILTILLGLGACASMESKPMGDKRELSSVKKKVHRHFWRQPNWQ